MEELFSQIATFARGMWKYRWVGLAVTWIVAIAGSVVAMSIPDQHEANARIYVDTQTILKPLMSGLAVQPNVDQQVTMLSRTLISRPNIEKLIRMADLDLGPDAKKMRQDVLVETLMKGLEIKSAQRDNLYFLSFRDSDPAKAQRVVQSLVSIFVESSLGASRKDTDSAKVFINEQIKSYQNKLEEAEGRLKAFRLRNIEMQAADGKDSAARMADFGGQLDAARLQLREAENARNAAKAAMAQERAGGGSHALTQSLLMETTAPVATPEIDTRLELQRRNLDGLLQRYTDLHPDVVSTRRLIAELEEQKKKEMVSLRKAAAAGSAPLLNSTVNSLAYQELGRVLATSEVQVAALRARVGEYQSRYNNARAALKTAPQIEAELAQLNRDYDIHKKNYEDLVGRREAAKMSGDLEVASGLADFRVIDPPRTLPHPVAPNRLLLLFLALLAAVAAGLFVAFLLSQLRPVFHQASELRARFELPVIGVVSKLISEAERRRERLNVIRFGVASGTLLVLFATGLTALSVMTLR